MGQKSSNARRTGRPKGRVPGSLRAEEAREGVPRTTLWRERVRERVISLHPWLAERVPWSYRHFERYDRALREFDLDEVALRRWVERVNAQAERWFDQRDTRAIPWTTSVFLCRALRDDCRRRRIGAVPPRAGKTPQGRFLPRL